MRMNRAIHLLALIAGSAIALGASSRAQEEHHHPDMHYYRRAAAVKNPGTCTKTSVARGKSLFVKHCAMCHGPKADGNTPVGRALNPPAANLPDAARTRGGSNEEFFMVVTNGIPGTGMPSFEKILSAPDRWNVVDYLTSLGRPKPTNAE